MFVEREPRWHQFGQRVYASGDLEDAVALAAVEVVMVFLPVNLVARNGARQFDDREPTFVRECPDIPVDRRNAETSDL